MKNPLRKISRAIASPSLQTKLSVMLLFTVALLYAPTVKFEFLNYDDPVHVTANPFVTQFVPGKLGQIWSEPIEGLYIPLTYTVWGVLGRLSAWLHPANDPTIMDPAVFHVANIVLHSGAVLVVFAILRLLLKRDWPAAGGALLFAVHPVQISPVAWVSGMRDGLSGFLGLLAILQYLRYASTTPTLTSWQSRRYLVALGFFIAALLAKPNAVNIPLMAAILAIVLMKRDWRLVSRELFPWLLLTIPLIIITKAIQPSEVLSFVPNLWQRVLVAGDAITFYISKIIWPFRLGPDYGRSPDEILASGGVYFTGLLPFVACPVLFWRLRRPWLLAGCMVFVAGLLPVLGFIPFAFQDISTVANRYLYSAMLGSALMFGRFLQLYPGRRITATALILLLMVAVRSADRLKYWHDSLSFNQRAVEINPKSYVAYNNLGLAYRKRGRIPEAIAAFSKAIANEPRHEIAYVNLATMYAETGLPQKAKEFYLKAVELAPPSANLYMMLAILAQNTGEIPEAFTYYQKSLEIDPGFALAYYNMGVLNTQLEHFSEAIGNYQKALAIAPYLPRASNNLGKLYELTGRKGEAMAAFRQAVWLQPENPDSLNNLGSLLINEKRSEEAVPLLRKAVALAPGRPDYAYNLGLAYLNLGYAHTAAELFRQVLRIDPNFFQAQYNLTHAEELEQIAASESNGESDAEPAGP